jgi:SAM-dependent methyltransferase
VSIDYDHAANRHALVSPRIVVPFLFDGRRRRSLLDVGCGIGTWLRAAREYGIEDLCGVDGADIPATALQIPAELVRQVDLTTPWSLNRRFDVVLCLEVAEHLDEPAGRLLVETLTSHTDEIVSSAACPGQPGQHHINCQWPDYWQTQFNARGFVCSDAIRWRIWTESDVDVWYRQNMFVATRDTTRAGQETRLEAVVHPDFLEHLVYARASRAVVENLQSLQDGVLPVGWYAASVYKALAAKVRRQFLPAAPSDPAREESVRAS